MQLPRRKPGCAGSTEGRRDVCGRVEEGGVIWLCYFLRTLLQNDSSSHILRRQNLERQRTAPHALGVPWGKCVSESWQLL